MPASKARKAKRMGKRPYSAPFRKSLSYYNPNQIYTFRQYVASHTLAQATTFGGTVQTAQFAYLADATSFAALFDQYRITKLEFVYRPMYTATSVTGSALALLPLIYTVVDTDDSTAPTTASEMQQYGNCRVHDGTKTFKISFKPLAQTVSDRLPAKDQWIDMANTTIPWYGTKIAVTAGTATYLQQWNVDVRYTFQCKGLR